MIFPTKVKGVTCNCRVDNHVPFTFSLVDTNQKEDPLLTRLVDEAIKLQMAEEYQLERIYEYYQPY